MKRRAHHLREFPLCTMCLAKGIPEVATIADHVTPHEGNPDSFYFGSLQSLCKPCHDGRKKREELHGYQSDVGLDGWPTDPRHPSNIARPSVTPAKP